jgi:hypothetical protein
MSQRALNPEQFEDHLEGLHPSLGGSEVPDVIQGRVAKHVFAQAGVRQTKRIGTTGGHAELVDAPHIAGTAEGYGKYGYRPHHEELWTSQAHLHMPTLQRYASGDIPTHDAEEWDPHYEPETYHHGGKTWLAEGHHRTVASRLAR